MSDIVERLRLRATGGPAQGMLDDEAANEIERLKAALQLARLWARSAADALQPSAEKNTRLRAEVERLRAALRAMAEAPYEQPIGVWQYMIRAALEGKPEQEADL